MGRKKKSKPKPRTEWTYATTSGQVNEIALSYDPVTDTVRFDAPVENTYHEVSYDRSKRPKVLSRTPLKGSDLRLHANRALEDFDLAVAVDTNTRYIEGRHLSVTGIVLGSWITDPKTQSKAIFYRTPFCIEFVELIEPREKIGWTMALTELASRGQLPKAATIALVVDAYLGDIPSMNARERPLVDNFFLPEGVTLLYASADAGAEYGANKLIRYADQVATQVLDYLSTGRAAPNNKVLSGRPFKGYRIVFGKNTKNK